MPRPDRPLRLRPREVRRDRPPPPGRPGGPSHRHPGRAQGRDQVRRHRPACANTCSRDGATSSCTISAASCSATRSAGPSSSPTSRSWTRCESVAATKGYRIQDRDHDHRPEPPVPAPPGTRIPARTACRSPGRNPEGYAMRDDRESTSDLRCSPGARCSAAWASRWRCPGSSRRESGATTAAGRDPSSQPPVRFACLFSGNGFHSKEWWARGAGRDMELGKVLEPLAPLQGEAALHPRPLQRGGPEGEHPQLADRQPALRGAAGLGRRDPVGDEHRPGPRPADRRPDEGPQPGPGVRAVDGVGPQELLDALQLAHLVELADLARRRWSSTPRSPSTGCSRTTSAGRQERPRRRARRRELAPRRASAAPTGSSSTST